MTNDEGRSSKDFASGTFTLGDTGRNWLAHFAVAARLQFTFVMHVRTAQKRHSVENVFLEPFEPEINHRRHEKCDHLRENEAANDHETKWTPRRSVVPEPKGERHCAHESSEGRHHDRAKTLEAGFVNGISQTQSLINSFQREIDHQDSVLLDYAEQKKQSDDAIEGQARSKNPQGE